MITAQPMGVAVKHAAAGTTLQFAEVTAECTLANGVKVDLGVLDQYESPEHEAKRESMGIRLARKLCKGALSFLAILAIARASQRFPEVAHAVGAATVITNAGQAIVTNRMIGSGTEPKFVMWGTGAGTAAITDTTLFTETTDEARTTGTSSRVTTTVTNDTYQVVGTITVATTGKTITNVALFDVVTASSGNMYFKSDFTGLALSVADSITFTIKTKFS